MMNMTVMMTVLFLINSCYLPEELTKAVPESLLGVIAGELRCCEAALLI